MAKSERHSESFRSLNLREQLFAVFLFFLPFSQALTIQLFFPLKVSELILLFYLGIEILTPNRIKFKATTVFLLIYFLCVIILASVFINFFYNYPYELNLKMVRLSPIGDSLFKFVYLILAVTSLSITHTRLNKKPWIIKYLFFGTASASCYCWYLFFSGIVHLPIIKLPGMEPLPQTAVLSIGEFVRCGTAKEGNFMAFFLFIVSATAINFNYRKLGYFFLATLITTFSTVGLICMLLYLVLVLYFNKSVSKTKFAIAISVIAMGIVFITLASSDFRALVINKVIGTEETVDNQNDIYSRVDRLNSAEVGLVIFLNDPIWGVGMSNYSLHFDHFNMLPQFDSEFKRIPNNIYIELLAESGLLAFIVFVLIIVSLYKAANKSQLVSLKAAIIVMFVYFFAIPTYTLLFIWVFFGVIIAIASNKLTMSVTSLR